MAPKKNSHGEINFPDYPDFRPNLTPREIFKLEVLEEPIGDLFIPLLQKNIIKINIKNILNLGGKIFPKTI